MGGGPARSEGIPREAGGPALARGSGPAPSDGIPREAQGLALARGSGPAPSDGIPRGGGGAVVTGAGSGIGRAVALGLVRRGLAVVAAGRTRETLEETAALARALAIPGRAPGAAGPVVPVAADVGTAPGRAAIVDAARSLGGVRLLVHGAGAFTLARLTGISEEAWRESIATNLDGRLFLTRGLLGHMDDGARVLFVGSRSGYRARIGAAAYCVSQAASHMLRRCLQQELAPRILVSSAIPGSVDTRIIDVSIAADPLDFPDGLEYRREKEEGLLVAPETVGAFFSWLLLDTPDDAFVGQEWQLEDPAHRAAWRE